MKVNESLKTISNLPHYASLLRKAIFKADHAQFLKLCVLKFIILLEKQYFQIFQYSNICNEMKVDGSIEIIFFITQRGSLSREVKLFTSHTFENCVSSNVSFNLKNNIFVFLSPQRSAIKTNKSMKTIVL